MPTDSTQDTAVQDLAMRLHAATTAVERRELLAETSKTNIVEVIRAVTDLARDFLIQGQYVESMAGYERARDLAEQYGEAEWVGFALHCIGIIHEEQGRNKLAVRFFEEGAARCEQVQDRLGVARGHNSIGVAFLNQGNYRQALQHLYQSLTLKEKEQEKVGDEAGRLKLNREIGITLLNIGVVLHKQGDMEQSLYYFKRSLVCAEEVQNEELAADCLHNIGAVHEARGEYAQALSCYAGSLRLCESLKDEMGYAQTLINIGMVHCAQEDYEAGLAHFQDALARCEAISIETIVAETLTVMAGAYLRMGTPRQALECAARAAKIAAAAGNQGLLAEACHKVGEAHRGLGALGEARAALEESVGIIERLRDQLEGGEQERRHFFETQVFSYHSLVDLLILEGENFQALAYAERAKARVLLEVLQGGRRDVTKAMTAAEQEAEQALKQEIHSCRSQVEEAAPQDRADLTARLEEARRTYDAFRMRLYAAHPELRVQRGEAAPLTESDVKELLRDRETALLEYVVMEQKTCLFVMTLAAEDQGDRLQLNVFTIAVGRKELEERMKAFRTRLAAGRGGFPILAQDLYDLLLRPAQECLLLSPTQINTDQEQPPDGQRKKSLIIVPDGPLWDLPFQALQPKPDRYLLEDCPHSLVGSLTVLREMDRLQGSAERRLPSRTLFAVGSPDRPGYPPLPETERQVQEIARLYGKEESQVYVGAEATEEKVKAEAGEFRILHLAAHAELDPVSPLYSSIVLAQAVEGSLEDGFLEAWEIMALDLAADLAVLPNCQTARGQLTREAVIGLSWALFIAGCPTAVLGQWNVQAGSTSRLMVGFYQHLQTRTTAAALQQAALQLRRSEEFGHPFHWASLVVVGAGR